MGKLMFSELPQKLIKLKFIKDKDEDFFSIQNIFDFSKFICKMKFGRYLIKL